MLIKQIIEFELRGRGPKNSVIYFLVHVLLQVVIFMKKQKFLEKIFEWIIIYCWNIARGNVP